MEQLVFSADALGAALSRLRKAKNLSQTEAGKLFGLEQSTVSSIENGAPGTRLESLFRLLAALDLELVVRDKNSQQENSHKNPDNEGW